MSLSPVVDLDEWCKLYGINKRDLVCDKCGAVLKPIKTIAWKNYRGVEYTECEHMNPFTVVPLGEAADIWNGLKGLLKMDDVHFEKWTNKKNGMIEKSNLCSSKTGTHTLSEGKVNCTKCLKKLKEQK